MRLWIAAGATLLLGCSVLVDLEPLRAGAGAGAGGDAGAGAGGAGGPGGAGGTGGVVGPGGAGGAGGSVAPYCGDSAVDPLEECDDGNDIDDDDCSNQCVRSRRVFVTSTTYTGNMDGLDGADERCQDRAAAAGFAGTFRAWLSDSTGSPSTRMHRSPGYYVLTTGEAVATSWADLTDGEILRPIDRDELGGMSQGTFVCEGGEVWSNTTVAGDAASVNNCNDWTATAGASSSAGNVQFVNDRWTSSGCGAITCQAGMPIYCVEQ